MYNTSQNYKAKVLNASTQHELKIYIDGNEVEANHIINFKQTIELFNNSEFCLGCTPEIDIEFEIDKRDLPETYNEVYIETGIGDEVVPIGHFTIQKPIEDNEFKVKIKATDYMKKFEDNKYDGSNLTYPQTMLQVLKDICTKIGVELGSTSFLNSNKQIAVYDNTVSARTYLGYIAEQAEGIAVIGRDGKLYIRQLGQDIINFDINLFKDYKWGDKFKVSKVSYEDGIQDYKFGDETADTVYIDQNNMYIVDREQVENIYNQIKDFEIYSFEGETIIDPAYDIGDILVIDGKRVLYQGEINYEGKFKANIKSKIQAKTEQESMQTKENNTTRMRRVESQIDQINGEITQVVKTTTTLEEEITDITTTEATASGKNIHIEDSAEELLVDIVVKGETKQETRSGKNLLNVFSDEWVAYSSVKQADGSIKANLQDNYYSMLRTTANKWKEYILNNAGKTLTFSVKESFPDYAVGIVITGERTSTTLGYQGMERTKGERSVSLKIADDFTSISSIELRFFRKLPIEKFIDTTSVISELQLEEGSEVTDYEPYGASPSPDYPSEIENVEGKNKLDLSKCSFSNCVLNSDGKSIMCNIVDYYWAQINTSQFNTYLLKNKGKTLTFSTGTVLSKNTSVVIYGTRSDGSTFQEQNEPLTGKCTFTVANDFTKITSVEFRINRQSSKYTDTSTIINYVMLEEGTVATEYAPYNSLGFKVIGKNIIPFPYYDKTITAQDVTFTQNDDGSVIANGTATANGGYNFLLNGNIVLKEGKYTLSGLNGGSSTTGYLQLYVNGKSQRAVTNKPITYSFNEGDILNRVVFFQKKGAVFNNLVIKPQLEYNEEATAYEPYKSQTKYFPLAEGQKLYEGSYLADDGIHNKRTQVVFTGNEDWALTSTDNQIKTKRFSVKISPPNPVMKIDSQKNALCMHFANVNDATKDTESIYYAPLDSLSYIALRISVDKATTAEQFKAYLAEQYSNGTPVIVEYELAEEEIIPYTEEQQEAWDRIKELHTYKNITNITSTADLDIVYVRDNGLSDMYETKQNANKRYTETTEKFAETKMTTDSIQDTVSKTETTVANNYDELKTKFNDYAPKSDIITIQNSVEKIQTDTYTKTEINTKLTDGSVTKVQTTAGTFGEDGLTIEKTNAKTKGKFNEKGMQVVDATGSAEEILLFAGYDETTDETIVKSKNMTVEKYLVVGTNCRFEDYENPVLGGKGTGVFSL